jgi:hypothetical protein
MRVVRPSEASRHGYPAEKRNSPPLSQRRTSGTSMILTPVTSRDWGVSSHLILSPNRSGVTFRLAVACVLLFA